MQNLESNKLAKQINAITLRVIKEVMHNELDKEGAEEKRAENPKKWFFGVQDKVIDHLIDPFYLSDLITQMKIEKEL